MIANFNILLGDRTMRVKEAAEATGYANPFYFSRVYRRHFGVHPSVRRGA